MNGTTNDVSSACHCPPRRRNAQPRMTKRLMRRLMETEISSKRFSVRQNWMVTASVARRLVLRAGPYARASAACVPLKLGSKAAFHHPAMARRPRPNCRSLGFPSIAPFRFQAALARSPGPFSRLCETSPALGHSKPVVSSQCGTLKGAARSFAVGRSFEVKPGRRGVVCAADTISLTRSDGVR